MDRLLEPCKAYKELKNEFNQNVDKTFNELLNKSQIDVEANRKTALEYRKSIDSGKKVKRKKGWFKFLRGALIFFAVLAAILCIYGFSNDVFFMGVISLVVTVVCPVIVFALLNKKIKTLKNTAKEHDQNSQKLLSLANYQMSPLNSLFDSGMTTRLIQQTIPSLVIDENFDMRRYDYMNGKYGLGEQNDGETSTIGLISGELQGNPYLFERTLTHRMGMQTYTGTLTITYSTYERDSNGRMTRRTRTQVLYAHVRKPKPFYSEATTLLYGNDAATELTFSRTKTHAEQWSERKLESKVKAGIKKIRRKAVKNLSQGFTEMGNEEFDVLFGALDRDNEVQFRLLFTPLAQKNMLDLIKGGSPFGDDFNFYKNKGINYIISEHAQKWDFDSDPTRYISYDVDLCAANFKKFNQEYFDNFYFDLAPLLSIPMYQQIKPKEYIYREEYARNYTARESEVLANKLGGYLSHPASRTPSIIKTELVGKRGGSDKLRATAYSYRTVHRIDFVPTLGADGRMHAVPVPWIEYIPIGKTTEINLRQPKKEGQENDQPFSAPSSIYHGIMAIIGEDGDFTDQAPDDMDEDNVDYGDIREEVEKIEQETNDLFD